MFPYQKKKLLTPATLSKLSQFFTMIEPTTRKDLTDNELMLKVQNGNLQMMGLLYERHRVEAYAYFYRCTNSKDKSEDLVHNLFMRLIKYRHTFRGDGEFRYWLFATARNVWYDDHRKKNPLRHGEDIDQAFHLDDESSPQAELEKKERKKLVHEALLRLSPEKTRSHCIESISRHEISRNRIDC